MTNIKRGFPRRLLGVSFPCLTNYEFSSSLSTSSPATSFFPSRKHHFRHVKPPKVALKWGYLGSCLPPRSARAPATRTGSILDIWQRFRSPSEGGVAHKRFCYEFQPCRGCPNSTGPASGLRGGEGDLQPFQLSCFSQKKKTNSASPKFPPSEAVRWLSPRCDTHPLFSGG